MDCIVGYTGFVGSNLCLSHKFDRRFNSKNIADAYGQKPDLCVFSGVRAEKFLANTNSELDLKNIKQAVDNIVKISPKKLVLISTVDVLSDSKLCDETADMSLHASRQPYGANRLYLEKECRRLFPDCCIVRLPGLFGQNIKKNLIYDLINVIPSMLSEGLYTELCKKSAEIGRHYSMTDIGFYRCDCSEDDKERLREVFSDIGFCAADFTDSESRYQFFDLSELWQCIELAMQNNLSLLHIATEPVYAREAALAITGRPFENHLGKPLADYDMRTRFYELFGGSGGYIRSKTQVLHALKAFSELQKKHSTGGTM